MTLPPPALQQSSHSRRNPLTGEWVLVSPHRLNRPWQGALEPPPQPRLPAYDPDCYLCPGNERANGAWNPPYESVYVFDNDFPALQTQTVALPEPDSELLGYRAETGICRVICFSPRHDLTFAQLSLPHARDVVAAWVSTQRELMAHPEIGYVQIFENKGEMMGCSNAHPHGQVWATRHVPNEPAREDRHQLAYHKRTGSNLLLDYLRIELKRDIRIVERNEDWVVLVPYWAVWPFETMICPRRMVPSLGVLERDRQASLAEILLSFLQRYDRLFGVSMPFSMGWHGAPGHSDSGDAPRHWLLHAHYYPPLLRSATVRKYLVGFEMLGQPQRDFTPEQAAQRLREA